MTIADFPFADRRRGKKPEDPNGPPLPPVKSDAAELGALHPPY